MLGKLVRYLGQARRYFLVAALALPLGLTIGCHSWSQKNDCCPTIEKGAIAAPVGTYQNEFNRRQADKAEADDFVIYHYEFNEEGTDLGPAGTRHVLQLGHRLKDNPPHPVVIEATGNPAIDQSRRNLIVTRLMNAGVVDAEQRVAIGLSAAEGLYGDEAPRIYNSLIRVGNYGFNANGGFGAGGGYGGYGGFGAGNFSGGFGYIGAFGGYGYGR